MRMSVLSKDYVRVKVRGYANGAAIDPTSYDCYMACPERGVEPTVGDWFTAAWESDALGNYWITGLVGPGGNKTLPVGTYDVWVKLDTGGNEVPVLPHNEPLVIF